MPSPGASSIKLNITFLLHKAFKMDSQIYAKNYIDTKIAMIKKEIKHDSRIIHILYEIMKQ
jgi:hypothetical protein